MRHYLKNLSWKTICLDSLLEVDNKQILIMTEFNYTVLNVKN